MDTAVKNLREWVLLLMALFCVLDLAAVQYAMSLVQTAAWNPDPSDGRVVSMLHGPSRAMIRLYVTQRQITVLYSFLGAASASFLGALGIIVGHGMRVALATRETPAKSRITSRRPRK